MHEKPIQYNPVVDTLSGADRSIGRLPANLMIPGGVEIAPHENGFKLHINSSIDPTSHAFLEREFLSYSAAERDEVQKDYQTLFPTVHFVPDHHLYLVVGGKPKFGLIEDTVPIINKEFIKKDDPDVVGFHSNMMGEEDIEPFFEYYIRQPDSSMPNQALLITVGIRMVSNDFGSINEALKTLHRTNNLNEAQIRRLVNPYLRLRGREVTIDERHDEGGERLPSTNPKSPIVPDGQFAEFEDDTF